MAGGRELLSITSSRNNTDNTFTVFSLVKESFKVLTYLFSDQQDSAATAATNNYLFILPYYLEKAEKEEMNRNNNNKTSKEVFHIPLQQLKQLHHTNKPTTTVYEPDESYNCLCHTIRPLLTFCQYFGIIPLINNCKYRNTASNDNLAINGNNKSPAGIDHHRSRRFDNEEEENGFDFKYNNNKNCELSSKWLSLPYLINISFCCLYIYAIIWSFKYLRNYVSTYFQKTDLYAYEFKIVGCLFTTAFILLYYKFKSGIFIKHLQRLSSIWNSMHGINNNLTTGENSSSSTNNHPDQIKSCWPSAAAAGAGSSFFYTINGFIFIVITILILNSCIVIGLTIASLLRTGLKELSAGYIISNIGYVLFTIHHQTSAAIFSLLCFISRALHIKLGRQLRELLPRGGIGDGDGGSGSSNRQRPTGFQHQQQSSISSYQLERIRLLHISLINSTKALSNYFGVPVLCICCTGVIIITCGIYSFIFKEQDQFSLVTIKTIYLLMFCSEVYFASITIATIVISGQMLSNSVSLLLLFINQSKIDFSKVL